MKLKLKKYLLFENKKMKNVKKVLSRTLLSVSAIACCYSPAANATTVIGFESYGAGTIITSQYADVTFSAVNNGSGPDVAVIFDTRNPTGGDLDLVPASYDPGNILIIHETNNCVAGDISCKEPDDEASGGIFRLNFTSVVTLESIDFFDIETDENGQTPLNAIKLFDDADNEIMANMFYVPDTGGDFTWGQLEFNVDGVKRVELNMAGSGAIDNVAFSRIPVPAAVWLFGSGLIGLTALARRKKT